jgi:hypothetical protein
MELVSEFLPTKRLVGVLMSEDETKSASEIYACKNKTTDGSGNIQNLFMLIFHGF